MSQIPPMPPSGPPPPVAINYQGTFMAGPANRQIHKIQDPAGNDVYVDITSSPSGCIVTFWLEKDFRAMLDTSYKALSGIDVASADDLDKFLKPGPNGEGGFRPR